MKFIILMFISCSFASFSLYTMEQDKQVTHMQKKARFTGPIVEIKQEDDNYAEVEIKTEDVEAPVACAASSDQSTSVQNTMSDNVFDLEHNLVIASQNGSVEHVRELLPRWDIAIRTCKARSHETHSASIDNIPKIVIQHMLHSAIENGHENVVRLLLARPDISVNDQPDRKMTAPLTTAAAKGNVEIVRMLLNRPDIDVNIKSNATTALIYAAENGHENVVRLLLSHHAIAVNEYNNNRLTALTCAIRNCHSTIVKLLLERPDIDVNIQSNRGNTALMFAIQAGHYDIIQMLLRGKTDLNILNDAGDSALCFAIRHNRTEIARVLIERPDLTTKAKEAALVTAGRCENKELVTTLLEHLHTNINEAFRKACRHACEELVRLLLNLPGININSQDEQGKTGIMYAITPGFNRQVQSNDAPKKIVKMLLNRPELAINAQDHETRRTALMYAVKSGHKEIVQMLLAKAGIDINARTSNGYTALMLPLIGNVGEFYAQEHVSHREIVRMLLYHPNININAQNDEGWTALMFAAKVRAFPPGPRERTDMVQLLLAKPGINLEAQNSKGETALTLAVAHKNTTIANMLIRAGANRHHAQQFGTAHNRQTIPENIRNEQALILPAPQMPVMGHTQRGTEALIPAVTTFPIAVQPTRSQESSAQHAFEKHVKSILDNCLLQLDPNTIIVPILLAAKFGDLDAVKKLLKRDADSAVRDHQGNTALHLAILQEHAPVALDLIESGININLQNNIGQTPLMLAAYAAKTESMFPIFKLLLEKADKLATDSEGKTYRDYLPESLQNGSIAEEI